MAATIPDRLPNGLKLLNVANPRYVRDCLVHPEASRLRIEADILSDANDASVGMWRLAESFFSIASEMQHTPREASLAIVDGLVDACAFEGLIAALRADRDATETNLNVDQVEDICREISGIRLEMRQHIASVFAEAAATESTSAVTPAAIAEASAQLHVSISALVFSEEENGKYAPDSPRRNRGKALLNRLHSAQAAFERGTPSAATTAPTPYAAKVENAFRAAAAGVTSLSVPSTVDAVAAQSTVFWMQRLVTRLEDVGAQARKLGGSWRRLNLVWQAELRGAAEGPDAVSVADAKDPYGIRVAFQSLADAAAAAIPQSFDFACDEARRVCDTTLPVSAKAATLRNDCTFNCLTKAAQVLDETRLRLFPMWEHVSRAGPLIVIAARDVAAAQVIASESLRWTHEVIRIVRSMLRDPKDVEHRDLAKNAHAFVQRLTSAATRSVVEKANIGPTKESDAGKELRASATTIAEWVNASITAEGNPQGADTSLVRPALAVLEAVVLGHQTVTHTVETLRAAILAQCILGATKVRWEKATPAQRAAAIAEVLQQNPCGFADAVTDRLNVLAKCRELEFTVAAADQRWLPLARAWSRLTSSFPPLEPHLAWEVGAQGCKFTFDVAIPLTMDQLAEAEKVSGHAALDYAVSAWDATLETPAVRDAVTAAVLNEVTRYVSAASGPWPVVDRRAALAADTSGSWRFALICNAIRTLGAPPAAAASPTSSDGSVTSPTASTTARPHPLVDLLDEFLGRIAMQGIGAINTRDTCMKAICADIASYAPHVLPAWEARAAADGSTGALWICPQCSWWRPNVTSA